MTVRVPDGSRLVSRSLALWLVVGLAGIAAACRGPDSSTNAEEVAYTSRNQQFEDCCKHQFGPGRHRDECIEEARHGRCRLDCRPPRREHDAGAPDAVTPPCPTLTPITTTPQDAGVIPFEGVSDLSVSVLDPSGIPAGTAFSWSTTGGSLIFSAESTGPVEADGSITFVCSAGGTETISVTALTGDVNCVLTESIDLTCSSCGDGIVESGEQCDPPSPGICSSTCQFAAVCGDKIVGPGEQCDPPHQGPDGLQCGANCQLLTCGNGVIDPGEQCDPPKSSGTAPLCSQTCQIPTCGNGVIDPGEQCDPPKSSGAAPFCSSTCQIPTCGNGAIDPGETCDPPNGIVCDSNCQSIPIVCGNGIVQPGETCDFPNPAICNQCQLTSCGGCYLSAIGGDPACGSVNGTARVTCQSLLSCMAHLVGTCFFQAGGGGNTACFCSDATCSAGANGSCVPEFEAVAGSSDPSVVLQQLNDPTSLLSRVQNEGREFAHDASCDMFCRSL